MCPRRTAAGGIHCWPAESDGTTFQIAPGLFLRPGSELGVPLVDLGDDPYGEDRPVFETNRDPGDETDVVRPATLEEAVREVLDTWLCANVESDMSQREAEYMHKEMEKAAHDLAQRIERYGKARVQRGKDAALVAFTGDTLREGDKT